MRFFYNAFILVYWLGTRIGSWFSPKVKRWREGRRGQFRRMRAAAKGDVPVAWFHCASLGEFEQGRPVIEGFRETFPKYRILLTFFSPSGYEIRKNYEKADHVFYLPLDTPLQVKWFFDIWDPKVAVFVKYEFWFNYLDALYRKGIPSLVISAIFWPEQHFFKPYGGWFRRQLKKFSHIFVQNPESLELLQKAGINQASVSGDTRFDRVAAIAGNPLDFPLLKSFAENSQIIVAGSTWPGDEELLLPLVCNGEVKLKYIIAPHEISADHIADLKSRIGNGVEIFSEIRGGVNPATRVLIIDQIGLLSSLYQFGSMAYIGGGFGRGIHNVLEAVTFGLPVFFGPRYQVFAEAVELKQLGGAFPVTNAAQLLDIVKGFLNEPQNLQQASMVCRKYIDDKKGATRVILDYLKGILS